MPSIITVMKSELTSLSQNVTIIAHVQQWEVGICAGCGHFGPRPRLSRTAIDGAHMEMGLKELQTDTVPTVTLIRS